MVTNVTSLTGNGLKDWLIQRVTAIYFAMYVVFLLIFLMLHQPLTFDAWHLLFESIAVKIATVLALLTLLLHAWIGLWTVTTDYLKCIWLRLPIQMLVLFVLVAELVWGLMMLWGY